MGKDKLPKSAIPDIVECAKYESKYTKEPVSEVLKHYFGLMNRYRGYFFDASWPKEYEIDYATTFNDTDITFLEDCNDEEFSDRLETVCIKKNLFEKGFMTFGKLWWTFDAFKKQVEASVKEEQAKHSLT
jgi:hypothetical protein